MRDSYLDYAMSVITQRALPDVRDGLKPVQRRILFAMDELALRPTSPYKKSARIVGDVLGRYHPHGDSAVYEAMVRMAQGFSMRYPLVDGQGNFGSVDGDRPAAMRYTEARLARIAEECLADIDKNTVDFTPNFDGSMREPSVLPSKIPGLLINGASGIAVGMATNIAPHNLSEVVDAVILMINRYGDVFKKGVPFDLLWARVTHQPIDDARLTQVLSEMKPALRAAVAARAGKKNMPDAEWRQSLMAHVDHEVDVTPDELMEHVKGPDFPTAGVILGTEGIKQAYTTGHGRVLIRALAHTEDMRGGRTQIVVTEIPYQINKATLIEKIADLVRDKRLDGISDLRDESDRQGMRIVIELKRDANPRLVLNQLYKMTAMQSAFSINSLALVDGQPRVLTLKMLLQHFLNFRKQVITRRTEYDLEKARQRAHILEGLALALDHLDEVIQIIRGAADADAARTSLISRFKFSDVQAQAILDMQLRRLAALERKKIIDELKEIRGVVAKLEDLLANPIKILYLVRDELNEVKEKYGDERRTRIIAGEKTEFTEEDLIPNLDVVIISTVKDYVKRMPAEAYRVRRGARGVTTTFSREDDAVQHILAAKMHDAVLFFTNRGRVFQVKVYELPDAAQKTKGIPLVNLVQIAKGETVTAIVAVPKFEADRYMMLFTRGGEVKRVALTEYQSARANGLISMVLPDNDELVWARLSRGDQEVLLTTIHGRAIRFSENNVRASGRPSGGVRGIRLAEGDRVVGADLVAADDHVLLVTEKGFGKRVALSQFSVQGRGGGGIRALTVTPRTGRIASARIVSLADEVMIATRDGLVVRTAVEAIPAATRVAMGAPIVQLEPKDTVAAVARLRAADASGAGDHDTAEKLLPGQVEGNGHAKSGRGRGSRPGASAASNGRGRSPAGNGRANGKRST
ncbi:MAG TPA: DNA gyrase subunit A, partial [Chloroflexota bacterium]|nr:DNA gyrase subunit A [Chloroflexota bacterium]